MSGGKGGEQKTEIPGWLEDRAKSFMERADQTSRIGYTPYFGPDVAAVNPMERQAMQNTVDAAGAFGLGGGIDPMAGMPEAQTFAGGVQGYSSAPIYEQAVAELKNRAPGQFEAYAKQFVDPAPSVDAYYFDPNNPAHVQAREEREAARAEGYPEGYEWLKYFDIPRGGGFL